ncbi:hypothetical protein AALF15_01295 [Corynebacteriaceae bacterium 7-707]
MTTGYAKGVYIHGDRTTDVRYDPAVDGPIIHPDTALRWARRELDRLNDTPPRSEEPMKPTGGHLPKGPRPRNPDAEPVTLSEGYAIVKDEATARTARQLDPDVPIFISPVED